jgi:hypothetical protein
MSAVPRPAFDLGLFLVCTAAAAGMFAVPWTVELLFPSCRPFDDRLTNAAAAYAASLFLGVMLYGGLRRAGVRRGRPEQAEDYGDGG